MAGLAIIYLFIYYLFWEATTILYELYHKPQV